MPGQAPINNAGSRADANHGSTAVGSIRIEGDFSGTLDVGSKTVIIQSASEPLRPTPPAPPAHFTGREAELDRLVPLLTSGESIAITALQGMGGIGKTALALKLAERVKDIFHGGILWWSLSERPDVRSALAVWARHFDPRADLSDVPSPTGRANLVRSMLDGHGKLCAFLDDVWDYGSTKMLMSAIPPSCPILITTRNADLAKALRCSIERIDTLTEDESVALLSKLLGPLGRHEPVAREIAHRTGGLPLALELIYGLADSPADLPMLARKLQERPALEILKIPVDETRGTSVEACFTLSYIALDKDMQRRFRALGAFAPAPFDRAAIAAVWNEMSGEVIESAIHYLIRRSLLAKSETPGEYRQHTLLHEYALALLKREDEYEDTVARYADYYWQFAVEKDWRAVERAFQQIDWGWQWVQSNSTIRAVGYALDVQGFLAIRGRQAERLAWLQGALARVRAFRDKAGRRMKFADWLLKVVARLIGFNEAYAKFMDSVLALLGFKSAPFGRWHSKRFWSRNRRKHKSGLKFFDMEGKLHNAIGQVYISLGQQPNALKHFRNALIIFRGIGNRPMLGTVLNNVAAVYDALGQRLQALGTFLEALTIRREVGDRGGEGTTLNNIAGVYSDLGQKQQALDTYRQALAIVREVGNRPMEGTTLNNIGMVYSALGQKQQALDILQQALAIAREVGDRGGEGTTLNNIGLVYSDLGQKRQALEAFQQALTIIREVGDRWSESVLLSNIGLLLDDMGRTAEAIGYLDQNVALDEAIGHPDLERDRARLEEMREKVRSG